MEKLASVGKMKIFHQTKTVAIPMRLVIGPEEHQLE